MSDLKDASIDELQHELARRRATGTLRPAPLDQPDFSKLRSLCESYLGAVEADEVGDPEDIEHYIYEAALEACYGPSVWVYVNETL